MPDDERHQTVLPFQACRISPQLLQMEARLSRGETATADHVTMIALFVARWPAGFKVFTPNRSWHIYVVDIGKRHEPRHDVGEFLFQVGTDGFIRLGGRL